jgi:hypothetical protein
MCLTISAAYCQGGDQDGGDLSDLDSIAEEEEGEAEVEEVVSAELSEEEDQPLADDEAEGNAEEIEERAEVERDIETNVEAEDGGAAEGEDWGKDEVEFSGVSQGDEEDEGEVVVVGKKRKALQERYDPIKARRRNIQEYYGQGIRALCACVLSSYCLLLQAPRTRSPLP